MTAREYLNQYQIRKRRIDQLRAVMVESEQIDAERIELLRGSLILPGHAQDGMPHTPSSSDRMAAVMAEIDLIIRDRRERRAGIVENLKQMQDFLTEIMNRIGRMQDESFKGILIYRYILNRTWYEISEKVGYSDRYIQKELHSKSIREFEQCNQDLFKVRNDSE